MRWILWMSLILGLLTGTMGAHDSADPYGMVDPCPPGQMCVVVDDGSPF